MRWRLLAGTLAVVLIGAVVFSLVGVGSPALPATAALPGQGPVPAAPSVPGSPTRAPPTGPAPAAPPSPLALVPPRPPPSPSSATRGSAPVTAQPSSAAPMPGQQPVPQTPPDAGLPFRLDKDGIKAAVAERIPELRECYDAWLEANPSLAGKIKVSFTIAENPDTGLGDVIEIGVLDGGLDHFALQGCVMNVFQDLHFEAPVNGPVKVNYPLSFANAADAGG